MKISVVIVSYNARFYLEQCLLSVLTALKNTEGEIIVVDNASPEKPIDFLRDKFSEVRFIESKINLGFGKANNLGVANANGEFVLILNPDTVVPEDLFVKLLPFAESKENLGAIGVRLVNANGNFHPESKRNIPSITNTFGKLFGAVVSKKNMEGYYKSDIKETEIGPSEVLVGAFMLIQKTVYQKVGGFDEKYFMYGEDIDLSYTLIRNGFTNYYFGESTIIHYKGESTRKDKKYLKIFYGAMQIFVEKYHKDNVFKYWLFRIGLVIKHAWAQLHREEIKKVNFDKKLKEYPLKEVLNYKEISNEDFSILLDPEKLSYKEIISIILMASKEGRDFFIKQRKNDLIIGDGVILKFDPQTIKAN